MLLGGAALGRAQDFQTRSLTDPTSAPNNVPPPVTTQEFQPIGPVQPGDIEGMQLFAPADLSEYGDYPRPNVGPWFQYDRIYWSTHQPKAAFALDGTPLNEYMDAAFQWGNRFELGYMQDDDTGWMTSILKTNYQLNNLTPNQQQPIQENFERMAGIELEKVYRYPTSYDGGVWQCMIGARFFQFHDRYVDGTFASPPLSTTFLPDESLGIDNNVFGPQIGLRWQYQKERWTLISEIRAMGGANFQNAILYDSPRTGFVTTDRLDTVNWATIGELRVETQFQVSKSCSLRVGYTAIGGTGFGRASDRIDPITPSIINGAKENSIFTNGLTFGIEFNR